MEAYNESLSHDKAFYAQDIAGSIAWARANKNVAILTEEEFEKIETGFGEVKKEWETDTFNIKPGVDEVEPTGAALAGSCHANMHVREVGYPYRQRTPIGRSHWDRYCGKTAHRPKSQ